MLSFCALPLGLSRGTKEWRRRHPLGSLKRKDEAADAAVAGHPECAALNHGGEDSEVAQQCKGIRGDNTERERID